MRQNIIEDVWADIFDVAQSTISRYITFLTPFVELATEEDRPAAEDAAEATRNAIALVDGTLWPCWSWNGESKLWSGKYKTTGHGSLIVTNLQGRITFVSEPVTGNQHDMAKLKGSDVEEILKKAGGVFGDKGFIGTDYLTTPIRAPARSAIYKGGSLLGLMAGRAFAGHSVFSCACGLGCLAAGVAGGAIRSRRGLRSAPAAS